MARYKILKLLILTSVACPLSGFGSNLHPDTYQTIALANIFRLRPIESKAAAPPPQPIPKIRLAGISTFPPGKQAFLNIQSPPEPGKTSEKASLILGEGERADGIQVLEINDTVGTVKLQLRGEVQVIGFQKDDPWQTSDHSSSEKP